MPDVTKSVQQACCGSSLSKGKFVTHLQTLHGTASWRTEDAETLRTASLSATHTMSTKSKTPGERGVVIALDLVLSWQPHQLLMHWLVSRGKHDSLGLCPTMISRAIAAILNMIGSHQSCCTRCHAPAADRSL